MCLYSLPSVTIGGLVVAFIHRAAAGFVSKSPKLATCPRLLHVALQFFRPTLASPREAVLTLRVANVAKISVALHVELIQDVKTCVAGYIM